MWEIIVGRVPLINESILFSKMRLQLPFTISRWTDVLFFPLLVTALVGVMTRQGKDTSTSDLPFFGGLVFGLIALTALVNPSSSNLLPFFAIGLLMGWEVICFSLIGEGLPNVASSSLFRQFASLGTRWGMAFGLPYGLGVGLTFGLMNGMIIGTALALIFVATFTATVIAILGALAAILAIVKYRGWILGN
jgi:hypothetical protein